MAFSRIFLNHPADVGESYGQHFLVACGFAGWLLLAAGAALVHALVPALCTKTASRITAKLNDRLTNRSST